MEKIEHKIELQIPPLSVNQAWKGRRYKTEYYKKYEHDLLFLLPRKKMAKDSTYEVEIVFRFTNANSDCTNPIKLIEDILSKKYGFNDNRVMKFTAIKQVVPHKYVGMSIKIIEIPSEKIPKVLKRKKNESISRKNPI